MGLPRTCHCDITKVKILYIENYLPYRVYAQLILSRRYIFLKSFKGSVLISHNLQSLSTQKYMSHIQYLPRKTADDTKCRLIMLITILHALTITYALISVYCMLPCTGQFLTELYNYTLIMLITFHIAACYSNYFITFVTHSTYFLSKSLCNRNKTFMKNSSKIFKVFKHGR